MMDVLKIHPVNPQPRLIRRVVECLDAGGVIAYPTDSSYALGCLPGDKAAMERIRAIRHLDEKHLFTLVCRDLSEISTYARVDNTVFRLLKAATPGAYTFVLPATREVPKRVQDTKRKSIGIRVPDNAIDRALLEMLNGPLISSTLLVRGDDYPMSNPDDVKQVLRKRVDLLIDGGSASLDPTTVVDMTGAAPRILRSGRGSPEAIGVEPIQ